MFSEMTDIPFIWNKIRRGLPRERDYADDRIPAIEEIRKIFEILFNLLISLEIKKRFSNKNPFDK